MVVLFAHDGYVFETEEGIYSDTYDNKIVERYLSIAENVVFMVRTRNYINNDDKLNKITIENFKVVGIENFKSLQGIFRYMSIIAIVKREVQKADYIIARIPSDLGFLAAKYAKKYNKRYMVEIVGCPWDSLKNHSLKGKVIAPFYYIKQKKTVKRAPYAIYVTNEFLQNRYPCRGKSIGCSDVELQNLDKAVLIRRIKKIKAAEMCKLVFGTLGTLNMKYKGYDTVIKAFAKLNSEGYSYKYLIAGSGDPTWLKSVIHKYHAEDFVTITPPMPHEKVFEWLDNIDIYIQPSKTEGMPRALIEAMSRACPCIGTDTGGIPELISQESIYERGNSSQLTEIVANLSKDILLGWHYKNYEKAKTFNSKILYAKRERLNNLFIKD